MVAPTPQELGWGMNVLLCVPPMDDGGDDTCVSLLTPQSDSALDVLWVSFTRSAGDTLDRWREQVDVEPVRETILGLGEAPIDPGVTDATVEQVGAPGDLTGLGIAVRDHLESADGSVVVCFESLTSMLQYVDLQTAYEFIHVLTGQLYAADSLAHFHLTPDAHDDRTVTTLTSLFDAVVTVDGDTRTVRTRPTFRR